MRNFELPGRSPVYSQHGMASTSQPLATQTAIDVLKAGGNALDGAIAACAVQCVTEPQSTGIGGDCFCLYSAGGSTDIIGFNGSGRAPAGLSAAYIKEHNLVLERTSPHSVILPGAVDAWFQLNRDHGRMPLADLLAPAIDYAKNGFPLSPRVVRDFKANEEHLNSDSNLARIFMPGGQVPEVGDVLKQTELASTLAEIARSGRDGFYLGDVASDMVDTLQALGGVHTLEDFANASGDYVTPITTEYRGHTVYECPPNGQGLIALLLLNLMKKFDVGNDPLAVKRIHQELEACRLAYRSRTDHLADPQHADVPVERMLSDDYADTMRQHINENSATVPTPSVPATAHQDTVYISVVDSDRNCCSFINTLFWPFGSGITTPKTGIVLTNRGEGFVLDEKSPNCLAPGKRPLHTIIPALAAKDGRVNLSFGVMGGEYQAMGQMQFLSRYLDYGCDIQEAQDLPRFMVDPFSGEVEVETGIPEATREALRAMGHSVAASENPIGGSQAIAIDWDKNVLSGGSDPRKDGCSIGY